MPETNPQVIKKDPEIISPWMYRKWQELPSLTFLFMTVIIVSIAIGAFTEVLVLWIVGFFLALVNFYIMNSSFKAKALHLSKDQYPKIYNIFEKCCLKMGGRPDKIKLYIEYSPIYNAYAFGVIQKSICLHSALVDDFSDEELEVVICHEIAHIMAGHTVILSFLPRVNIPFVELFFGFYSRNCEYTCDRAAVAVTKNVVPAVTGMMKLFAGAEVSKSIDYSTFGQQMKSAQYDIGVFLAELSASHPLPVKRVNAILKFAKERLEKRI